jgi:hypothetical protein
MDTHKICTKCGHKCHCDRVNCPDCINDVCGICNCKETISVETDARKWPWQDSGVEHGL